MNVQPVVMREMRAEARHAFTYWLRVLGAAVVICTAGLFILFRGFRATDGARLFTTLHATLQISLWVLVPLLAADCLSRERREGTLGLLFLTPLKALDVVVAKSTVHGLRGVTLLLSVLPVIALPLLIGGVSWQQAFASLCLNVSALCLALAAGVLASSLSKSWVRALILAFCFSAVIAFLFCKMLGWIYASNLVGGRVWSAWKSGEVGLQLALGLEPYYFVRAYYYPTYGWGARPAPGAMYHGVLVAATIAMTAAMAALTLFGMAAAWLTARSWQERPPHPALIWLKRRFCQPVVMLGLLQRWMRRSVTRNPIGWLERRTWSGRLVIWGWLAALISVYSLLMSNANYFTRNLTGLHKIMGWMLLASMATNASTSFRRERETRVLELLLVSPVSEGQIILGRLRGLWGQFLPSVVLLVTGWFYLATALNRAHYELSNVFLFAVSFVTLPVIGLYYSLIRRNFLTAICSTVGVGIILPAAVTRVVEFIKFMLWSARSSPIYFIPSYGVLDLLYHPALVQFAIALWLWHRLHRRLTERRFAMESA